MIFNYFFSKDTVEDNTLEHNENFLNIQNNFTKTTNNANSLKTTDNIHLDFFMQLGRDLTDDDLNNYMRKCMYSDPYKTIAIIYNCRDRKDGKKEKEISNKAIKWLKNNNWNKTYEKNIYTYIDKYGCWKDILYILLKSQEYNFEYKLIARQLIIDKEKLDNNNNISLCAKWMPSENNHYDKKLNCVRQIVDEIYKLDEKKLKKSYSDKELKNKLKIYREYYLSPLRKKINIIESLMCKNKWTEIEYEKVPGIASKKLKNAFIKHDSERYNKYLQNVISGKSKINVTGILPHELVNYYLNSDNNDIEVNDTIEAQWKTIVEDIKKNGIFDKLIPIVDVSGSMFSANNGSIPAQVSIALGLLISQCTEGLYKNKVITFSEIPEFHLIEGDTLKDQIDCIKKMNWGYNTNFELVAKLIVDFGIMYGLNDSDMPDKLVILSDMQFDQATNNNNDNDNLELLYNTFGKNFINNNYKVPKLIYWNLNSDYSGTFPVNSTIPGTSLISGFSEQLLKIFIEYDEFTPELILNSILEKYIKNVIIDENELHTLSEFEINKS